MQPSVREHDSAGSSCQRQQDAFGGQLPDESPSSSAQRGTNCYFVAELRASCYEKTRDIWASNQQHAEGRSSQNPEAATHRSLRDLVDQRDNTYLEPCICRRILLSQFGGNRFHLRSGFLDRPARLQSSQAAECVRDPESLERGPSRIGGYQHPQLGLLVRILKIRRHHAYDGDAAVVQLNRSTQDCIRCAKTSLPHPVTKYRHVLPTLCFRG